MSILSKLRSVVGGGRPRVTLATSENTLQPVAGTPEASFDPTIMVETVKAALKSNIRSLPEFDKPHADQLYDVASVAAPNGDLAAIFNSIQEMKLPGMTKARASEIARSLSRETKAFINRERQLALGITQAIWMYPHAPCMVNPKNPSDAEKQQDAAHRAADGKQFELAKGMLLNGKMTWPGREAGCKCASRPVLPF